MAENPYLPLWIDAYMADTDHLSDAEHGLYLRLLMVMWRTPGCSVPNDDEWLARRFRRTVPEVRATLRPIIREFCHIDDKRIHQKRLMQEFEHVKKMKERQSQNAKSRWEKEKDACHRNAGWHASGNAPKPKPKPINITHASRDAFAGEFEEAFWPLYPRKAGKGAAKTAYAKARAKTSLEEIVTGVRRLIGQGLEERFTPHPATWLNQERWTDQTAKQAINGAQMTPESQAASEQWWIRQARCQARTGACEDGKFRDIPPQIAEIIAKETQA